MWITTNPSHEVFRTSVADPDLLIKVRGGGPVIHKYIHRYIHVLFISGVLYNK